MILSFNNTQLQRKAINCTIFLYWVAFCRYYTFSTIIFKKKKRLTYIINLLLVSLLYISSQITNLTFNGKLVTLVTRSRIFIKYHKYKNECGLWDVVKDEEMHRKCGVLDGGKLMWWLTRTHKPTHKHTNAPTQRSTLPLVEKLQGEMGRCEFWFPFIHIAGRVTGEPRGPFKAKVYKGREHHTLHIGMQGNRVRLCLGC